MATFDKDSTFSAEYEKHFHIFRRSIPQQLKLEAMLRALGKTDGQVCLEIGVGNGAISYYLRKHGGKWDTVVKTEAEAESVRSVVDENVRALGDAGLSFKKKVFDAVVIVDLLEHIESDHSFIEECHRILKADGRLVLNVLHAKPVSLMRSIRKLLGVSYEDKGMVSMGYTEAQLFSLLKHGFDVHNVRSYSRFFVELVDAVVQRVDVKIKASSCDVAVKRKRLYSIAGIFYRIALQLDALLFMTRGHYLIAVAKRRTWRARKAPILTDGRSISEAVLSKALE